MTAYPAPLRSGISCAWSDKRIAGDSVKAAHYWPLLDALTAARARYQLLPATLVVLKALCSFLPKQPETLDGPLLVWPSNETLCERASGIAERSLRRHLDRLVNAGLILRKASTNGKRFALRIRQNIVDAFGFDLSPLFTRRGEIFDAREAQREQDELAHVLRTEIRVALYSLEGTCLISAETCAAILLTLRRKADIAALEATLQDLRQLQGRIENQQFPQQTAEMTGTNGQNDRHLQNTDNESISSVLQPIEEISSVKPTAHPLPDLPNFDECTDTLRESIAFSPDPVRNWLGFKSFAQKIAPMIGIDGTLLRKASVSMGEIAASVAVLCLVQLSERLRVPAAYYQKLVQLAQENKFSLQGLLRAAGKRRENSGLQV